MLEKTNNKMEEKLVNKIIDLSLHNTWKSLKNI